MSHFRLQAAQEQVWLPRMWPNMGRNMDRNMFCCQHGGYHAGPPEGFWKVSGSFAERHVTGHVAGHVGPGPEVVQESDKAQPI